MPAFFWLASILSFALSACATTQLGTASKAWHRIRTAHFTLYTDLAKDEGVARAEDFERWLSAFQQHGFHVTGRLPLRLNIVVFRSDADFRRHGGQDLGGYYVDNLEYEPWVVMPAHRGGEGSAVFRHELTHYISGLAIHHQPAWFSEGLASYFESAHFEQANQFVIGSVPPYVATVLRNVGPLSVGQLFSPATPRNSARFYASAWLVVHYLMSEQGEAFEVYQTELTRGQGHEAAWAKAFPALPPERLQEEVQQYLFGETFAKFLLPVDAKPGVATATELTLADEHALQGMLWASRCDGCSALVQKARVARSMNAALAADPYQPQALSHRLAEGLPETGLDEAKELVRRHPEEWLAWMTLGTLAIGAEVFPDVQREFDPVSKLRRLAPDSPYTHVLAAYQYAFADKRDWALTEADNARKKGNANPAVLMLQADVLTLLGACAELDRTLEVLGEVQRHSGERVPQALLELRRKRCEAARHTALNASVDSP